MKITHVFYTLAILIGLTLTASCNVHEWPNEIEERFPFTLYLEFDSDLPLYKEVYFSRSNVDDSRADKAQYDIRYMVNVYKVNDENDNNREVFESYTFSRMYADLHDYSVVLSLPEGNYKFRVWCDHVTTGTQADLFYSTSDFTEIKIDESQGHPGSNEMRDAFRGSTFGQVFDQELYQQRYGTSPSNSATALMQRPMGRYEFISTDMDEFLDKIASSFDEAKIRAAIERASTRTDSKGEPFWNGLTRDDIAQEAGLQNYSVYIAYNNFMPSSYNLYSDSNSDSTTGVIYKSEMKIGDEGIQLGFDYVLTPDETSMNLNMAIYNSNGDLISTTSGIDVPIVNSKNTIVKGTFLTVSTGGGVTINPDFDDEDFNIEIK